MEEATEDPDAALITEAAVLVAEKDNHLKQSVPIVAENVIFLLNHEATGLFIAETVSKTTHKKTDHKDLIPEIQEADRAEISEETEETQGAQTDQCLAQFAITAEKHASSHLNQERENPFIAAIVLNKKKTADQCLGEMKDKMHAHNQMLKWTQLTQS